MLTSTKQAACPTQIKGRSTGDEKTMLMDMHAASKALGICYRSLQSLVYARKIGFVKVGKNYKFRLKDLNDFIEKNYIKPVE